MKSLFALSSLLALTHVAQAQTSASNVYDCSVSTTAMVVSGSAGLYCNQGRPFVVYSSFPAGNLCYHAVHNPSGSSGCRIAVNQDLSYQVTLTGTTTSWTVTTGDALPCSTATGGRFAVSALTNGVVLRTQCGTTTTNARQWTYTSNMWDNTNFAAAKNTGGSNTIHLLDSGYNQALFDPMKVVTQTPVAVEPTDDVVSHPHGTDLAIILKGHRGLATGSPLRTYKVTNGASDVVNATKVIIALRKIYENNTPSSLAGHIVLLPSDIAQKGYAAVNCAVQWLANSKNIPTIVSAGNGNTIDYSTDFQIGAGAINKVNGVFTPTDYTCYGYSADIWANGEHFYQQGTSISATMIAAWLAQQMNAFPGTRTNAQKAYGFIQWYPPVHPIGTHAKSTAHRDPRWPIDKILDFATVRTDDPSNAIYAATPYSQCGLIGMKINFPTATDWNTLIAKSSNTMTGVLVTTSSKPSACTCSGQIRCTCP